MENIKNYNEPLNTNLLSQASDESFALGLIDEKSLKFIFNLNCLFFNHVAIGAPAILGNPVLYQMISQDPESMSYLYRNTSDNGSGLLQPILMGEHKSINEVAESMVKAKTIHRLSSQFELESHAQLISNASPDYLWCPDIGFRISYYQNMVEIVKYLNSDGLKAWSSSDLIIPTGSLSKLNYWLNNNVAKDSLRCSKIYNFADTNFSQKMSHSIKLLGETIYQYSLSSKLMAALSTPGRVSPFINCMQNLITPPIIDKYKEYDINRFKSEEINISLPLNQIANLSLKEIIIIRELQAFRDIRSFLADYRLGRKEFLATDLQRRLNECESQLIIFADSSNLNKTIFVEDIINKKKKTKLKLIQDATGTLIPILLLFLPLEIGIPLLTVERIASFATSRYLKKNEVGQNIVYPELLTEKVTYLPVDGELKNKDKSSN